jgi:molybdenum cofactor guanylyltransferase
MVENTQKLKNVGAIILAGGNSKRFGVDKALYPFKGKPLVQIVIETIKNLTKKIIIITNSPDKLDFLNYKKYNDIIPGAGSLGGLYTGLYHSNHDLNIVLPCDMPFISQECIQFLVKNSNGYDITVPIHNNMFEPLCAIYSKTCLPYIKNQIESEDYQVFQFYDKVKTKQLVFSNKLPFYHKNLFLNINTKSDLENIL